MIIYEDIEALIDGELSDDQAEVVMEKINNDIHLKHRYELIKKQKTLLKRWWSDTKRDH